MIVLKLCTLNYPDPLFIFAGDFNLSGHYWENNNLHAKIIGPKLNKYDVFNELIMFLQLFNTILL